VTPEFYTLDESGIPIAWVKRMREIMARVTPRFCANRTLREYTEQHYPPAASAYRERTAETGPILWQRWINPERERRTEGNL
jgi:glycogen phosphorylase